MDLIAGRKTTGKIEGEILVDGKALSPSEFAHMVGYVEQRDLHNPTDTVREALLFSAKCRLPTNVSDESRIAYVDEILKLLELDTIADRLVVC